MDKELTELIIINILPFLWVWEVDSFALLISNLNSSVVFSIQDIEVNREHYGNRIATYLVEQHETHKIIFGDIAEYSENLIGFKIKIDQKLVPLDVSVALDNATERKSSTINGVKTRYKFLSETVLSTEMVKKLKTLLVTFKDWTAKHMDIKKEALEEHCRIFYSFYFDEFDLREKRYENIVDNTSDTGKSHRHCLQHYKSLGDVMRLNTK